MARVNQGRFNELKKESSDLKQGYSELLSDFANYNNNCNADFCSFWEDTIFKAEELYQSASKLTTSCQCLVKDEKFEDTSKADKYLNYAKEAKAIQADLKSKCNDILSTLGYGGFSDAETETLKNMAIGREYLSK